MSNENEDPVQVVFGAWVEATGRTGRTRLTADRKKRIKRWLQEYDVDELVDAVRGVMRSEFHVSRGYTDIQHALKNEANIERFRDAEREGVVLRDRRQRGYTPSERLRRAEQFDREEEEQRRESW